MSFVSFVLDFWLHHKLLTGIWILTRCFKLFTFRKSLWNRMGIASHLATFFFFAETFWKFSFFIFKGSKSSTYFCLLKCFLTPTICPQVQFLVLFCLEILDFIRNLDQKYYLNRIYSKLIEKHHFLKEVTKNSSKLRQFCIV